MICDYLAEQHEAKFELKRLGWMTEIKHKGRTIHLLKPNTYMNLSGKSVNHWLKGLKVPQENLIVIMDDIALPFGKLRLRGKGSSAGHNGLKDIESYLGTGYPRLRFGVGNDFFPGQQANYVLDRFPEEEMQEMLPLLKRSSDMCLSFTSIGLQRTMSLFNG
jgi:PTH1 family peptidyl-tRNA hydrolase